MDVTESKLRDAIDHGVVAGLDGAQRIAKDEMDERVVLVTDTSDAAELVGALRSGGTPAGAEILLVAPKRSSKLDFWADDERAIKHSREVADHVTAVLVAAGFRAHGGVGDADPEQALRDALGSGHTGQIIVAANAGSGSSQDWECLRHLRFEAGIPVTQLAIPPHADVQKRRHLVRLAFEVTAVLAALIAAGLAVSGVDSFVAAALTFGLILGVFALDVGPKLAIIVGVARYLRHRRECARQTS